MPKYQTDLWSLIRTELKGAVRYLRPIHMDRKPKITQ
jgi:hypothetical protein